MTIQALEPGEDPVQLTALDPVFSAIVPKGAKLERLATGFKWTEGPIWVKPGYLLFAEIPSNTIRKWAPAGGTSIALHPSGFAGGNFAGPEPGSNGMTLDSKGRLTVAGHGRRNVWRLESSDLQSTPTVLADHFEGKRLSSPNDLVYRRDGSLYFTDHRTGSRPKAMKTRLKSFHSMGYIAWLGRATTLRVPRRTRVSCR